MPAVGGRMLRVLCQESRALKEGNTGLWEGSGALGPGDAGWLQLWKAEAAHQKGIGKYSMIHSFYGTLFSSSSE